MNISYEQKQIAFAYLAMIVSVVGWFLFMDSSPRDPRTPALLLWLIAAVVSILFCYRTLRRGSLVQRFLTLPLFLFYVGSFVFYMTVLTSPEGRH